MSWTNYHSHSHYCDGKYTPETHILKAIELGFVAFGCSSHAPVSFENNWSMDLEKLPQYCAEIHALKITHQDQIQVYLGMEVDYIPEMIGPHTDYILNAKLDYSVGSVHFVDSFSDGFPWGIDGTHQVFLRGLAEVFHNNCEQAVSRYFELTRQMVREDCPTIVGHMDKIKIQDEGGKLFSEEEAWYRQAVMATLEEIKAAGVIVEINTRSLTKKKSINPYPSPWIIEMMHEMDIPIMLNSDSHLPREIDSHFSDIADMLQTTGYKELMILLDNEWQPVPFDKNGIILPQYG